MIEIKLAVDDIDFDALAEIIAGTGTGIGNLTSSVGKAVFKRLPESKKEELALSLISSNRDKLKELLEKEAAKNGVKLTIRGLAAKKL